MYKAKAMSPYDPKKQINIKVPNEEDTQWTATCSNCRVDIGGATLKGPIQPEYSTCPYCEKTLTRAVIWHNNKGDVREGDCWEEKPSI